MLQHAARVQTGRRGINEVVVAEKRQRMGKTLVIVESPAKAKTINKYLGDNYIVKASMGHVRDLPKKGIAVDIEHNFQPTYEVIASRTKIVRELRSAADQSAEVYLATDLDREGEAIAWHLAHALGLDAVRAKRVVFNEITKSAILNAFQHPRGIDQGKVDAQQARRILDRLVGYKVSPLLWKKVASGLSAGRVQSVAAKLIVDREREILAFQPEEFWKLNAYFTTELARAGALAAEWKNFLAGDDEEQDDGTDSAPAPGAPNAAERTRWLAENSGFKAILVEFSGKKFDPTDVQQARAAAAAVGLVITNVVTVANDGKNGPRGIPARAAALNLTHIEGAIDFAKSPVNFIVQQLSTRQSVSRPSGPFSTSTLQQAASNQMGFGAQRTMRVAQMLYEGVELGEQGAVGLITYMRTDSQNISADALQAVRAYIQQDFGGNYLPPAPNVYASKAGAQEAHEAIRPTDVTLAPQRVRGFLTEEQYKLYELIWKRFVACQMSPARWLNTDAQIAARPRSQGSALNSGAAVAMFKATGRTLEFDGFLKVMGMNARFDEQILPALKETQPLAPLDLTPTQHFTAPPPRYTEASLVKALESEGIGRPSTYASIIATIQDRQYVEVRERRLFATDLGMKVTDKLVEGFPDLMETGFTRKVETELDQIEEAQRNWVEVVHNFYDPLEKDLATAESRMTHARAEATPSEYKCPECGAMMAYRLSKRGKRFLSCSRYPDCKGAMNVDREGKPVQLDITEFKCPTCQKPMIRRQGPWGPFFGCSGYPECKIVQKADRKTGLPLPPQPPPKPSGLPCPRCGKHELLVRSGKRGEFISCKGYPRCRMTLPIERLAEFQELKAKGAWPPPEVMSKAKPGGAKADANETPDAGGEAQLPADAPAKPKKKPPAKRARPKMAPVA